MSLWFPVVFAGKTATFGAELQVCMGPRPHLSFCAYKSAWLAAELLVSIGPRHNLSFCACKTAWLAPELLVSICPRLHLWFCACKTERLASELLVPMGPSTHLSFWACNTAWLAPEFLFSISTSITSLYLSQTSPVILCMLKERLASELLVHMGPSTHLSFWACNTAWLAPEFLFSICPNYWSLWVPAFICGFWIQNSDFWTRITSLYEY